MEGGRGVDALHQEFWRQRGKLRDSGQSERRAGQEVGE